MDRDSARKAAEVMLAYADGKEIESGESGKNLWYSVDHPSFNWIANDYRIKPTPTYRPFANAEECWEEMKKHEPFGWIKDKEDGHYVTITQISNDEGDNISLDGKNKWTFEGVMKYYTFADGQPFGVKEG